LIEIYTDGLAEPRNPGIGTYGYAVYRDGKAWKTGHGFDGEPVSNNHAEYAGLIEALRSVSEFRDEEIVVKSDSKMLVNQMSGEWKVGKKALKNPAEWSYVEMFLNAQDIAKKFSQLEFVWIPREENTEADALSRAAYREQIVKRWRR
jgi:ribonuclease HI